MAVLPDAGTCFVIRNVAEEEVVARLQPEDCTSRKAAILVLSVLVMCRVHYRPVGGKAVSRPYIRNQSKPLAAAFNLVLVSRVAICKVARVMDGAQL